MAMEPKEWAEWFIPRVRESLSASSHFFEMIADALDTGVIDKQTILPGMEDDVQVVARSLAKRLDDLLEARP